MSLGYRGREGTAALTVPRGLRGGGCVRHMRFDVGWSQHHKVKRTNVPCSETLFEGCGLAFTATQVSVKQKCAG